MISYNRINILFIVHSCINNITRGANEWAKWICISDKRPCIDPPTTSSPFLAKIVNVRLCDKPTGCSEPKLVPSQVKDITRVADLAVKQIS